MNIFHEIIIFIIHNQNKMLNKKIYHKTKILNFLDIL